MHRLSANDSKRKSEASDVVEPLQLRRKRVLVKYGIGAKLDGLQWHDTVYLDKVVDAFRPRDHVVVQVGRQHDRIGTLGTPELLARGDLYRRFAGRVGDEEVERNVFAVHVFVDPGLDVARHGIRVEVIIILKRSTLRKSNIAVALQCWCNVVLRYLLH